MVTSLLFPLFLITAASPWSMQYYRYLAPHPSLPRQWRAPLRKGRALSATSPESTVSVSVDSDGTRTRRLGWAAGVQGSALLRGTGRRGEERVRNGQRQDRVRRVKTSAGGWVVPLQRKTTGVTDRRKNQPIARKCRRAVAWLAAAILHLKGNQISHCGAVNAARLRQSIA
jgi:hypothetical protein